MACSHYRLHVSIYANHPDAQGQCVIGLDADPPCSGPEVTEAVKQGRSSGFLDGSFVLPAS